MRLGSYLRYTVCVRDIFAVHVMCRYSIIDRPIILYRYSPMLFQQTECLISLHEKWSFPIRISSVNVTKSTVSCGFGHVYWKNP